MHSRTTSRCHRCGTRVRRPTRASRTTRSARRTEGSIWHRLANSLRERADTIERVAVPGARVQARAVRLRAAHYDRLSTILSEGNRSA